MIIERCKRVRTVMQQNLWILVALGGEGTRTVTPEGSGTTLIIRTPAGIDWLTFFFQVCDRNRDPFWIDWLRNCI